jgi:4-alpha-glucanotransferase
VNRSATTGLEKLAQRMGIASEFRDARGDSIRTQPNTQRRLLEVMGIHAGDDSQVDEANQGLDRAQWSRALPPVKVMRVSTEPLLVDVVLPKDVGRIRWQLTIEDGAGLSGELDFTKLSLMAKSAVGGRTVERRRLALPAEVPIGYHTLTVEPGGHSMAVIIAPAECWFPDLAAGKRVWGIAAQLYLLRSGANWGIGDFGDLEALVAIAAPNGADLIGLNPLHALFPDEPDHASPYSPASRLLLNVLNIDVNEMPELQLSSRARQLMAASEFQHRLQACRASERVDYAEVARLKMEMLEVLFEVCRESADQRRWRTFETFKRERGPVLQRNCLFLALREHFAGQDSERRDWHCWPPEYRDANSSSVRDFARNHGNRLDFLEWLQWVADEQLAAVQRAATEKGMRIGLYRDLAVGADRAGAETWISPQAVVSGAHVGAPPDIHNPAGQDWGLPPFNPHASYEEAYRSFIELIRTNMRSAGGLRIDHAMGLQQLYWIPQGASAAEGAYVRYPMQDLLGILTLESHRNHCIVVGEDLGTVPEHFRDRMNDAGILSYRVLLFEQDSKTGQFIPPAKYPVRSLAVSGSHDLPTLRGWWEARDIDLKLRLGLFPAPEEESRQREARRRDRLQLLETLRREGLIDSTADVDVGMLVRAVHTFLGRSQSVLAMVQLDDLTDETEPVNVPGTGAEYPNWRRRLSIGLEDLLGCTLFTDIMEIFASERGVAKRSAAAEAWRPVFTVRRSEGSNPGTANDE